MSLSLIFLPDGVEPTRQDFRITRAANSPAEPVRVIHFDNIEQVVRHLKDRTWPTGEKPWVHDGSKTMSPEDIATLIGPTEERSKTAEPE